MSLKIATVAALLAFAADRTPADPLGFVEQRFTHVYFERGKWSRHAELPCFVYTANADNAKVEFLVRGGSDLVPFRAKKDGTVTICNSTAAMDEGFEAGRPLRTPSAEK
jgi:hypothetical protein